jgi:excisionase family DNA binding protein
MYYTIEEVAKILKVSAATVRKLIKSGEIETFRVGSQIRITQEALDKYVQRHKE